MAGLERRGWAGRVVWAFAPVQDRRAAPAITRALHGSRGDRRGRGHRRRARRQVAGRPVRILPRDAVPDRRDAARARDLVSGPPRRQDAPSTTSRRSPARAPTHATETAVPLHCGEASAARALRARLSRHAEQALAGRAAVSSTAGALARHARRATSPVRASSRRCRGRGRARDAPAARAAPVSARCGASATRRITAERAANRRVAGRCSAGPPAPAGRSPPGGAPRSVAHARAGPRTTPSRSSSAAARSWTTARATSSRAPRRRTRPAACGCCSRTPPSAPRSAGSRGEG